jgi:SOS response regulatory protein OraA/RecX
VAEAVTASRDGADEATWARRALARTGATGARAWRLLASQGFPEEVIADVLGEAE